MNVNDSTRKHWIIAGILILGVLLPVFDSSLAHAGWREKLKEAKDKAKDKWKERERRCSECGKVIHLGTKCASCKAKNARDATRRATERAKEKWQSRERACSECGKTIHFGQACATCKAKKLKTVVRDTAEKGKQAWGEKAHPCERCGKTIHIGKLCLKCQGMRARTTWNDKIKPRAQEARQRAGEWYNQNKKRMAVLAQDAKQKYGPRIVVAIRDPENREKVYRAVGAYLEVRRQMKAAKRKAIYHSLEVAFELPIRTKSGTVTLGGMAKKHLSRRIPGIERTGIMEDPAALGTAMITLDRKWFLTEAPLVSMKGRHVSVADAIASSSRFDKEQAMDCLAVINAVESVSIAINTGEGAGDAMQDTVRAIQAVRD